MEKRKEAREKALQEEEQFKRLKDLQYHHMHERSIKGNFPPSDVELGELHMLEERFKERLAREREAAMRVAREKKRAELKSAEERRRRVIVDAEAASRASTRARVEAARRSSGRGSGRGRGMRSGRGRSSGRGRGMRSGRGRG